MILFEDVNTEFGNDCVIKKYIQLLKNDLGVYLIYIDEANGWAGDVSNRKIEKIDCEDIEQAQITIDSLLKYTNIHINLKDYL